MTGSELLDLFATIVAVALFWISGIKAICSKDNLTEIKHILWALLYLALYVIITK